MRLQWFRSRHLCSVNIAKHSYSVTDVRLGFVTWQNMYGTTSRARSQPIETWLVQLVCAFGAFGAFGAFACCFLRSFDFKSFDGVKQPPQEVEKGKPQRLPFMHVDRADDRSETVPKLPFLRKIMNSIQRSLAIENWIPKVVHLAELIVK